MPTPSLKTHPDTGLLVLRLGLGAILLFHGIYKATHGVAWIAGPLVKHGLPAWMMYGVYIAEILAPVLLIFGLWTRIAALIIAFDMAMAIYLVRLPDIGKVNPAGGRDHWPAAQSVSELHLGTQTFEVSEHTRSAVSRPVLHSAVVLHLQIFWEPAFEVSISSQVFAVSGQSADDVHFCTQTLALG